jgi:hypothetical protein
MILNTTQVFIALWQYPVHIMIICPFLAVIVCQFKKKKNCYRYFIVIMITVLIMNVILVNFKTQNYFVISTTQNVYLRLSIYDCSNFVYSCRIFGIYELQTV